MSGTTGIPLKDVREWLKHETISLVEPLKAEGRSLFDEIEAKLSDVLETSDKLLNDAEKEIAKGSRKTYRRAKVMYKLAQKISETIDEVTIPDDISQESLQLLSEELGKTLATVGRERQKWFPVISPYFIIDRRRFDVALKRATDSLQKLRSFWSEQYTKAGSVENAFSIVEKLHQSLGELDKVEKQKKKMSLRKMVLKKKIEENQQRITAIQSQSEVVDLTQINEEVEELEKKVKHSLRYLQKPFLKFQSLVLSSRYSLFLDETKKLGEYLTNPFRALAAEEEGYPMLKRILHKMDDAMVQGKLKLKRSRSRKAKDQIENILHKNTLLSLHQSCKEALSKKRQLSTSGVITKSRNALMQHQENLRDLQKQKKLLNSKATIVERKNKEISERIEDQKKGLEDIVLELTNKSIQVLT